MLEKLIGANWKTTVSGVGSALFGLLTMLAALPYQLGDVATVIPPDLKGKVVTVGVVATFLLRVWNSYAQKDKSVTGGRIQQTVNNQVAEPRAQVESTAVMDTAKALPK